MSCRCNCGYRCGGQGRCNDPECLTKSEGHFVRDCAHDFNAMKVCSRCGRSRSIDSFKRQRNTPDGLTHVCLECIGADRHPRDVGDLCRELDARPDACLHGIFGAHPCEAIARWHYNGAHYCDAHRPAGALPLEQPDFDEDDEA